MNWTCLWISLFGTNTLWGIDFGFWIGMSAVLLIVLAMNGIFWGMKPKAHSTENSSK